MTLLLLLGACAGPNQARVAETPTASSKANTGLAPPASQSDKDRSSVVDSFDDMQAAQRAQGEANHAAEPTPAPVTTPAPGTAPTSAPKKAAPKPQPASPETTSPPTR